MAKNTKLVPQARIAMDGTTKNWTVPAETEDFVVQAVGGDVKYNNEDAFVGTYWTIASGGALTVNGELQGGDTLYFSGANPAVAEILIRQKYN